MSLATHEFDLSIMPGSISPVLNLSQYDDARTFTAHLKDESRNPFTLPSGASAKLEGMNYKGVTFEQACAVSGSDIIFTPKEAATDQPGLITATLHIKSSNENISPLAVILNVQKAGATKEDVARSPGFTDALRSVVNDYLDDYVEPVVDGAVEEYLHGIDDLSPYFTSGVSPEMFGAKGDGRTDDTAAIQAAVDSGKNVVFAPEKTYKCGTINVTKNIEIDCRWSEFVCTGETLFNCVGTVDSSVVGADYVANEPYTLLNNDKYTGFALIRSTDNVITMRDYYYGGFVTLFAEGVCNDCRPIGFVGVTVDKITPIICKIKDLGNVTFDAMRDRNTVIKCTYGLNCEFSGFDVDGNYYSNVSLKKCYRCKVSEVSGYLTYTGSLTNYYALGIDDSSECVVEDCNLTSDWWHCYDVGGNYLCYNNAAINCKFHTDSGAVAYNHHANAINSIVENCEIDNMAVNAGTKLINCIINENKVRKGIDRTQCYLNFHPTNIPGINTLFVDGLTFNYKNDGGAEFVGVYIRPEADTAGNTFVVDDVTIRNLYTSHDKTLTKLPFALGYYPSPSLGTLTINGKIVLVNVIGYLYMHPTNVYPNVAFGAHSKMYVLDSTRVDENGQGLLRFGTTTTQRYHPDIEVRDCLVWRMDGTYEKLALYNVFSTISILVVSYVNTSLIGDNCEKPNGNSSMLSNYANARLTNVADDNNLWPYMYINNGSGCYGLLGANGVENKTLV